MRIISIFLALAMSTTVLPQAAAEEPLPAQECGGGNYTCIFRVWRDGVVGTEYIYPIAVVCGGSEQAENICKLQLVLPIGRYAGKTGFQGAAIDPASITTVKGKAPLGTPYRGD